MCYSDCNLKPKGEQNYDYKLHLPGVRRHRYPGTAQHQWDVPEVRLPLICHLRRPAKKDAQERRENAAKEEAAAAALPKTSDIRYKTGAANMLEVFAYIVWVCGGISVIAIAILASQLRYSYYSSETTGTTMFSWRSPPLYPPCFRRPALRRIQTAH